jgi:hypothetical protein
VAVALSVGLLCAPQVAGAISEQVPSVAVCLGYGGLGDPTPPKIGFGLCWMPAPASDPAPVPASAPPVDPAALAAGLAQQLPLLMPVPHLSPSPDAELVQFPVWLWVDANAWQTQSASVSQGGTAATVYAVAVSSSWDMGDAAANAAHGQVGDEGSSVVVCRTAGSVWPGSPPARYDEASPDCGYSYRWWSGDEPSRRFVVTVSMRWHLSWLSNTGGAGDLGDRVLSARVPVTVSESQALVCGASETGGCQ